MDVHIRTKGTKNGNLYHVNLLEVKDGLANPSSFAIFGQNTGQQLLSNSLSSNCNDSLELKQNVKNYPFDNLQPDHSNFLLILNSSILGIHSFVSPTFSF